jgi:DNA-directed RNA polymerase subunit K/omega
MATRSVISYDELIEGYNPEANKTSKILSKYEITKILGLRMEQIARSGKTFVEIKEPFNPRELAERELNENKIPFLICRTLPNGVKEYWRLKDMIIRNW